MQDLHRRGVPARRAGGLARSLSRAALFALVIASPARATVEPTRTSVQTQAATPTAAPTETSPPTPDTPPTPTPTPTAAPAGPTEEPTWAPPFGNDPATRGPAEAGADDTSQAGAATGSPSPASGSPVGSDTPTGTPTPLPLTAETPAEGLFSINLPMESSLQIRGKKSIQTSLTARKYRPGSRAAQYGSQPLDIKQELQVLLDGKVGRKISVNVNYDDTRFEAQRQVISVRYQGDPDEIFEEAQFGDIQLNLGNTRFASYNKQLFGISAKTSFFDRKLSLSAVGAQTKGIVQTVKFVGPYAEVTRTIPDTAFQRFRYYWVHDQVPPGRDVTPPPMPIIPGSEEVWIDDGNPASHSGQSMRPISPVDYRQLIWFTGSHYLRYLHPGAEYTMDNENGILIFTQALGANYLVAASYTTREGRRVGHILDQEGRAVISESLLNIVQFPSGPQPTPLPGQTPSSGPIDDSHHITSIYDLGDRKLDPELFEVSVLDSNNIPQSGTAGRFKADLDGELGLLKFRVPRPFAMPNGQDCYNLSQPFSKFTIRLRYRRYVASYQLPNFDVVPGSERITLRGQPLVRDQDYLIDYASGYVDLMEHVKRGMGKKDELIITYEYTSPFGGSGQTTILGLRGEFKPLDNLTFGLTYVTNSGQNPREVPSVGYAPPGLNIYDADFDFNLSPEKFTRMLPPLLRPQEGALPVTFNLSGEVAFSRTNLNTFSARSSYEGNPEFGVAMLDEFDAAESTRAFPLDHEAWFPSSAPKWGPRNNVIAFDGSSDPARNNRALVSLGSAATGADPNFGWEYESSSVKLEQDKRRPLRMVVRGMTENAWDGYRVPLGFGQVQGEDFTLMTHLDLRLKQDGKSLYLMIEFGDFSEDSNGNGTVDGEFPDQNGYYPATAGDDTGVEMFYREGPTTVRRLFYPPYANNKVDTEDIERVTVGRAREAPPYYARIQDRYVGFIYKLEKGAAGWQQKRIPLNGVNAREQGYTVFGFGGLNPDLNSWKRLVRQMRIWVTGVANEAPVDATVDIDLLQLSGSRWEARRLPRDGSRPANALGTPVASGPADVNKFKMRIVSQESEPRYVPNTNWVPANLGASSSYVNTELLRKREKGMALQYRINRDDYLGLQPSASGTPTYNSQDLGPYAAVKDLVLSGGQAYDLHDYRTMKLDVYSHLVRNDDVLFVRLGADDHNYYQYEIPLANRPGWNTYALPLNGDDGSRNVQRAIQTYPTNPEPGAPTAVPTPACYITNASFFSLSNVRRISIGIRPGASSSSPGPGVPGDPAYEVWLDNLRIADPIVRWGMARRLSSSMQLGAVANLRSDFEDRSSTFREVEHQQRYEGVSLSQMSTRQANTTLNLTRWSSLPITLQWLHNQEWLEDRRFLTADDIEELRQSLSTVAGHKSRRNDRYIASSQALPHPRVNLGLNATLERVRLEGVNEFSSDLMVMSRTLQPRVEWDAPPKLSILPMGKQNRLSGRWTYRNSDFDLTPPTHAIACLSVAPVATPSPGYARSLGLDHEYRWTSRAEPLTHWNVQSNVQVNVKQGAFYLTEVSQLTNFQNSPFEGRRRGFFPYTTYERSTQVRVDQSYDAWRSVKPRLAYDATATRRHILATLDNQGRLDAGVDLHPLLWFSGRPAPGSSPTPEGAFGAGSGLVVRPAFRVDHTTTYAFRQDRGYNVVVTSFANTDLPHERRVAFWDKWGVYRWKSDRIFGQGRSNDRMQAIQGRYAELAADRVAPMAYADSYRETAELALQIPVFRWDLAPRGSLERRWSLSAGSFPTFDRTTSVYAQAQTQKVPYFLPFLQPLLKPSMLTLSGGLTHVQGYDWRGQLWQEQRQYTFGPALSFVPSDTWSGVVGVSGSRNIEHRQIVTTVTTNVRPNLQLNHQFKTEKPITLFNWFGFKGWTLRFTQALQMTYRVDLDLSRQSPKGASGNLRPGKTDRYTLTVGGRYQLMRSILWEANIGGEVFNDRVNPEQYSYREASVSTRLTAQF